MNKKNKDKDNVIKFPRNISKLERQVEAILFAAEEPLDIETIEKRLQTKQDFSDPFFFLPFFGKIHDF